MRYGHSLMHPTSQLQPKPSASRRQIFRWLHLVAMIFVSLSSYGVQDSPALSAVAPRSSSSAASRKHQPSSPGAQSQSDDADKQALMDALTHLQEKLAQGIQMPAPRNQSRLLPLLPPSSSFFVALPNYGEALHQASEIFHKELQESKVLGDFWRNKVGMGGMIVDEALDKAYQLLQFFGDEIAVTGTATSKGSSVLIIAEARKPGLKAFIQELTGQYASKTRPPVRVYTPPQLATAKTLKSYKPFLILVRPDFIVASNELAPLRSFNAQLNRGGVKFTSNPFKERIAQEYQNGAGIVFAADLHQLLSLRPHTSDTDEAVWNQTGFADLKYAVGEAQYGHTLSSDVEVSFLGPRKGIAAWLEAPAPLTGLDFISRDVAYVGAFNLKNLGQVFDDVRKLAETANPMAGASIAEVESELKINLKDDLFSKFSGQLVLALDGPILPIPAWKVAAKLTDSNGLERTLKQLIALANAQQPQTFIVSQQLDDGINYYTFHFSAPVEVECAFVDGFLVVAGSHTVLKKALQIRQNGESLAKSSEFQELLPRDQGNGASGILYQNLGVAFASMGQQKQIPPDQAEIFELISRYSKPSATSLYGSEDAIRMVSKTRSFDSAALMIAAIAIPNLMRSKMAANESAAAANVRTLFMAQSQYQISYSHYAPDLATLGPPPGGSCKNASESHYCIVDDHLGCPELWCVQNGFRFNIAGTCNGKVCSDFVILATPKDSDSGRRSFCSTSDAVVRSRSGAPLQEPISVSECQSWEPL